MRVPGSVVGALERYIFHKIPPGHFVEAVLENDLMEAFGRADGNNRQHMFAISCFIYNAIPPYFRGDRETIIEWLNTEEDPDWFCEQYQTDLHQSFEKYRSMEW